MLRSSLLIAPFFFIVICCGCSSISQCSSLVSSCSSYITSYFIPETLTFHIEASDLTNDRAPVYLLVKSTDFSHFLMDDYQKIANFVANPDEETSCLASLCLIPGTTKTIEIKMPEEKAIALYALFTNPGKTWKFLINTEERFKKVVVVLGRHEIESVTVE